MLTNPVNLWPPAYRLHLFWASTSPLWASAPLWWLYFEPLAPEFCLRCGSGSTFWLRCGSRSGFALWCRSGSGFTKMMRDHADLETQHCYVHYPQEFDNCCFYRAGQLLRGELLFVWERGTGRSFGHRGRNFARNKVPYLWVNSNWCCNSERKGVFFRMLNFTVYNVRVNIF